MSTPSTSSGVPTQIKVAAAQTETAYGDARANLARHLEYMSDARARGVRLLVFPELSLHGHSVGKDALTLAIRQNDTLIGQLAEASIDMYSVFGFVEEAPGGQFYNSQATVANGRLVFNDGDELLHGSKATGSSVRALGIELTSPLFVRIEWRVATLSSRAVSSWPDCLR